MYLFIRTHRHPVAAVTSLSSMLKTVFEMHFDPHQFNAAAMGEAVKCVSRHALFKAMEDFSQSKVAHSDVRYENLVSDPIDTVKRIYAQFGWPFTSEYEQILHDFLAKDAMQRAQLKMNMKQRKESKSAAMLHHYTAADFGLTNEELSSGPFAQYITMFNLHN